MGFLSRPAGVNLMAAPTKSQRYVVENELSLKAGSEADIRGELRRLAEYAKAAEDSVDSFLVLDRGAEEEEKNLLVFSLFKGSAEAKKFEEGEASGVWAAVEQATDSRRRMTWSDTGIGFITGSK